MQQPQASTDPPILDDAAVPGGTLLGGAAMALLGAAVGAAGGDLRTATPRHASYQPGRSLTVRYDATVRWADGRVATEWLVAKAGASLPAGALVLADGRHDVAVWRFPYDPRLPGLAACLDPDRVRGLLANLGARVPSAVPRLCSYRPGRRAVVEVSAPGARLFLKVVRPEAAEALHRRHVHLAGHTPVPRSLGWSSELGLVALEAMGGRNLRVALEHEHAMPDGAALLDVLDGLPDVGDLAGFGPDWQSRRFAAQIAAVAPELAERVRELADELEYAQAEAKASEPVIPVHGDFHEAQLQVDGSRISGVLDLDTYGLGRRVDDLGTMIGHLSTLAIDSPRQRAIERYAERLLDGFDRTVDPVVLRWAVAAVVLGLATGPFRVQEPGWRSATARRVHLAERWLASSKPVAMTPLPVAI